jgi:sulfide:quinone oxidoreductase
LANVVVLGGGFGGAAAALEARRLLPPENTVTLIDRSPIAHLCGANPLMVVNERGAEGVSRSIDTMRGQGIEVVESEVRSIDPENRRVTTSLDQRSYDYLVVALGTVYDWEAVPGSAEAFTFYDYPGALHLRQRLETFDRGKIMIAVARPPYKCPPAPLETAMLFDWYFRRRGIRQAVDIQVSIPEPAPLAVIGGEASSRVSRALDDRGIGLYTQRRLVAVENDGHRAAFSDGDEVDVDLLVVVPVHRVPPILEGSGLTGDKPWVPVDPNTLETRLANVWAVGDVTTVPTGPDRSVPKAGVFASGQGHTAAQSVVSRILDTEPPPPYDGEGHCFFTFSADETAKVGGRFLAEGGPQVSLGDPSTGGMADKLRWEADWQTFRV